MSAGDITSNITILINAVSQLLTGLSNTFPLNLVFGSLVAIMAIAIIGSLIGLFRGRGGN